MAIIQNLTFEVNTNNHVAWFDATVTRSTTAAQSGTASLLWDQLAAFSGVQLDNFPYFTGIVAGNTYEISCWYREGIATMPTALWTIHFYNEAGTSLTNTSVNMPYQTAWTRVSSIFTAPTNATRIGWTFETSSGLGGSSIYIDSLVVEDYVPPVQSEGSKNSNAMSLMGVY